MAGSSPRLRGTRAMGAIEVGQQRFIPAFAGNTQPRGLPLLGSPVHPRVCGEHGYDQLEASLITGSSPRLRGTLSIMPRSLVL